MGSRGGVGHITILIQHQIITKMIVDGKKCHDGKCVMIKQCWHEDYNIRTISSFEMNILWHIIVKI